MDRLGLSLLFSPQELLTEQLFLPWLKTFSYMTQSSYTVEAIQVLFIVYFKSFDAKH